MPHLQECYALWAALLRRIGFFSERFGLDCHSLYLASGGFSGYYLWKGFFRANDFNAESKSQED